MNNTEELKPFPICIFGHRRRKLAVFAIECLKKNLKTTGYTPKFIFGNCGTDKEYGQLVVEAIRKNYGQDSLHKVFECPGEEGLHNGLNQAMNACLRESWKILPVALRLEDDWILQKPLDIGPWIDLMLQDPKLAMIRLGQLDIDKDRVKPYRPELNLDWLDYAPNARYPINHQVGIVHKRLYDLIGTYNEQMSIDEAEFGFGRRFRVRMRNFREPDECLKVLWVHGQPLDIDTHKERYFVHGGISSPALKHDYFSLAIPEWLIPYQEQEDLDRIEKFKKH